LEAAQPAREGGSRLRSLPATGACSCVVSKSSWPASSWIARTGAPRIARWLRSVWRSSWAAPCTSSSARRPARSSQRRSTLVVIVLPSSPQRRAPRRWREALVSRRLPSARSPAPA
jgi:hypothetical protein